MRIPLKSLSSYANTMTAFVAFVLRSIASPPPEYVRPVPEDVVEKGNVLLSFLPDDERAVGALQALLFALFAHERAEGGDNQSFSDPTARAIVLFALRATGCWKDVANVTPIVARMKWCIRLTVFSEIVRRAVDPDGRDVLR